MTSNLFYVDLYNTKACRSAAGDALTFPVCRSGAAISYTIRFLEYSGGFIEKDLPLVAIRVSAGYLDQRPDSGAFTLQINNAVPSASNVTSALPWNCSASELENALNALSARPADFLCEDVPGGVVFSLETGGRIFPAAQLNTLKPRSLIQIREILSSDGAYSYELRPTVAPLAFTDSFERKLPDAPEIEVVQNGGSSGGTLWNTIQALKINPAFRGAYQLRYGYARTPLLTLDSTPREIQTALNALLVNETITTITGKTVTGSCTVTNPLENVAHIEFQGALAGVDVAPLIIEIYSAPPGDVTFSLPLNSPELLEALRDVDKVKIPFEAEGDFLVDATNPSLGLVTRKIWKSDLTVEKSILTPEIALIPSTDWLRPIPTDYVPFSPDQVITGQQHFSSPIGYGEATQFLIAHGLNTSDIASISVRNAHSGGLILSPSSYEAAITSNDSIRLTFPNKIDGAKYIVVVTAAGPRSAFQIHKHTISEIGDTSGGVFTPTLRNILDNLGQRVQSLEQLIGRRDVSVVSSGNTQVKFTFPTIGEILPDTAIEGAEATVASQLSLATSSSGSPQAIGGTALQNQLTSAEAELSRLQAELAAVKAANDAKAKAAAAEVAATEAASKPTTTSTITKIILNGIGKSATAYVPPTYDPNGNLVTPLVPSADEAPAVWPALRGTKLPWLLPAITDGSATQVAELPAIPSIGSLYTATAPIVLPGGGGRKAQPVEPGESFTYDGRAFYKLSRNGTSGTWHAVEMERELLRAILRPEQFPASSALSLAWTINIGLLTSTFDAAAKQLPRTNIGAQYVHIVEAVPIPDVSTSGAGWNVGAEETPVILNAARLNLTPSIETHNFKLSLVRGTNGAGTGSVTHYGLAESVPPIPTGPFVLRVKLAQFDVDDSTSDPRGQIKLLMPATALSVTTQI